MNEKDTVQTKRDALSHIPHFDEEPSI